MTSPPSHQYASQSAAIQEQEDEADYQQDSHDLQAISDTQAIRAAQTGPITRFEDLSQGNKVCATLVKTLTQDMGMETMTEVQSLTLDQSLKGNDMYEDPIPDISIMLINYRIAQARTGTGKTLAFLIPTLQNIINYDPALEHRGGMGRKGDSTDIRAIIISPTRELAEQIAVEAKKLTRNTGIIVQTGVGGSSKREGLRAIKQQGCHVLVGTPGRLKDLLSDPYSQVRAPNLSALVLDEADRLLDQGFAPDIEEIQNLLPDRSVVDRQTLLYSATVPREVMQIVRRTMKRDFKFVRTVREGEAQTHERVKQMLVNVGGFENMMPAVVELCQRELSKSEGRPFKAIVYFGATAEVSLASQIMHNLKRPGSSEDDPLARARLIEMHAKLTQEKRTRAADAFRRSTAAIMLSSDVTARGMDFPNVTHVIQVGLPPSAEQYVHRIGRTARAGQEGEGWLFINNLESREVRGRLRGLSPLQTDNSLETPKVDMSKEAMLPEQAAKILTQVGEATSLVPRQLKAKAYMANLGIFAWVPDKQLMVDTMNRRTKYGWGMSEPPMVSSGIVSKLSLRRVQGLNVGHEDLEDPDDGGFRGGGRFSNSGRGGGGGSGRRGYGGRSGGDFSRGSSYGRREGGGASRSSGYGDRGSGGYGERSYGDRKPPGSLPRGDQGQFRGHVKPY